MREIGMSADQQVMDVDAETEGVESLIQQSIERLQSYIDDSTQITPETLGELMGLLQQALSAVSGEDTDEGTMRDQVAKEVFGSPQPAPVAGTMARKPGMGGTGMGGKY